MDHSTIAVRGQSILVRQFEVVVLDGSDQGTRVVSQSDELSIGTADGNDLKVGRPAEAREHLLVALAAAEHNQAVKGERSHMIEAAEGNRAAAVERAKRALAVLDRYPRHIVARREAQQLIGDTK